MTTASHRGGRSNTPAAVEIAPVAVLASLEAAFEALPVGVLVVTPLGDRANTELRRIARVEGRVLDAAELERRLGPLDQGRTPTRGEPPGPATGPVRTALQGETPPTERASLERGDGSMAVVRVTARPIDLPDGPGAIVTVVDETALHEVQRLRDAFLGIVGHELRSPISAILGAAELIRDDRLAPAIRSELAGDLGDEARRLHELVEQLIRLADLRRVGDAIGDEPTHLPHLVRSRLERWQARQSRLQVDLDVPVAPIPPVAGEAGFVAQVVDILLDNAIKYAGAGTPITVRIEPAAGEVRLHVLDCGPGIPAEEAGVLFGLFRRGAPSERTPDGPPGHGIGLFVACSIVEALGGRIWATNRPGGRGADIGFALPVAAD